MLTRMRASAVNGAGQLCIFERWREQGHGAPTHLHAVEEVLRVLDGKADVWIGDEHAMVTSGRLVIVPAGRSTASQTPAALLHIESTLAAPVFEAAVR